MVISNAGNKDIPSAVFEYNPQTGNFSELQLISTIGATSVTYLELAGSSWLGFACSHGTTYSLILIWNATVRKVHSITFCQLLGNEHNVACDNRAMMSGTVKQFLKRDHNWHTNISKLCPFTPSNDLNCTF